MPVRRIQREEVLECRKIQGVAFVSSMNVAEQEKRIAEDGNPAGNYIAHFNDEGVITACMELPAYQMRYDGHWVPMVGVGGVASLPEYRQGGAVRQLMQATLREMVDSGAVFSALYPFSHRYYRKFGYELSQLLLEYELPTEALSQFRYRGKARMVQPGRDAAALSAIFDAHYGRYNMQVQRDDKRWADLIGKDPYKDRCYTYLLEDEAGPCAYVSLSAEDGQDNEKIGNVREIGYVKPQGLTDVLGLLYRLEAQYKKLRIRLPDDVPLAALLDESYDLTPTWRQHIMARVIRVQRALELKQHTDGADYTLRVRDDGIPENDCAFHVRCDGGKVSVEKAQDREDIDLTVDVYTMTQLLLGFLSIDEALYKPDVRVCGNLDTLRHVFMKRPVFLTEGF